MSKMTTLAALSAACAMLAACGGSDSTTTPPPPPAPESFTYYPPALGTTDVWTRTLTDSVGTTVAMQIRQRVTAVNDSGGIQVTYDDPTGTNVVEDGVTFRTTPEVADIGANDSTTDYTNTRVDGSQVTCIYGTPPSTAAAQAQRLQAQALRHAESVGLRVGDTWSSTYTIACGTDAPVTYTSTATVLPLESVTVAAGTFQAVKEIANVSYTIGTVQYGTGQTVWRDPAHSLISVKSDITYARSDESTPYLAHETRELLSRQ